MTDAILDRRPLAEWVRDAPPWSKPLICPVCGPERKHFINRWSDALMDANMGVPPQWQCWGCGQVISFPYRRGEEPAERIGELP